MDRREMVKAFLLNGVFYAAAIVIYILYANNAPGRVSWPLVAVLTVSSVVLTWRRVVYIQPIEIRLRVPDAAAFFSQLDNFMQLKDRWTRVDDVYPDEWHARYTARLSYGLYWQDAVLEATIHGKTATLVGPPRMAKFVANMLRSVRVAGPPEG